MVEGMLTPVVVFLHFCNKLEGLGADCNLDACYVRLLDYFVLSMSELS